MAKQKYYDISNILSTNSAYNILLGQRANGKSYQAKKKVLEEAYRNQKKFVYLRRWQADIKVKAVVAYFDDMPIFEITEGKYTGVTAISNTIYFTYIDENDEPQRGEEIGRYCALNEAERYKSWAFVDYGYMIYEEFITDEVYLTDEPRRLQQFVSTVARNNRITVIMVGNTLSRVCPYFTEWCLDGVLKQKQGTIEIYHFHTGKDTVDIAVEYCAATDQKNSMFFGQTAKQIISGEWDTKDLPKLPNPQKYYDKIYEILVEYQSFKFVVELLIEPKNGGRVLFIYPFTGQRKIMRIITERFSDNRFITNRLDPRRKPEAMIAECMALNKIAYSDNLTGADFSHVADLLKI